MRMSVVETVIARLRRLKGRLGTLWWHSMLMFGVSRLGDVINLYIGAFLVPAILSQKQLGMVLPLMQLGLFVAVPVNIVSQTAAKYMNVFKTHDEIGKIKTLLRDMILLTVCYSLVIIVCLWFGRDFIGARLKFEDPMIIVLVACIGVTSCWSPTVTMASQGLKTYYRLTISRVVGPLTRLAVVLLLLERLGVVGYLSATFASSIALVLFLLGGIHRYLARSVVAESYRKHLKEMWKYLLPVGLTVLLAALQRTIEPWIIRQRLPEIDSAGYYVAAVFGLVPSYIVGAILPFLFPVVSERHELKQSTRKIHIQALIVIAVFGLALVALFFFAGGFILSQRPSWRVYAEYAPFMWRLALVTTLNSVFMCHIWHENACRRFRYLRYYAPVVLTEVIVLYVLMGWGLFKPWFPSNLWDAVHVLEVRNLNFIVQAMLVSRLVVMACVVFEICSKKSKSVR